MTYFDPNLPCPEDGDPSAPDPNDSDTWPETWL